jgi:hypothetical protein
MLSFLEFIPNWYMYLNMKTQENTPFLYRLWDEIQ